MALRVTVSLDDDVAADLQKAAERRGLSLDEALNDSLRASMGLRLIKPTSRPFQVRAKDLHARPGVNFDDIEELLEQLEGPAHR